MLLKLMRKYVGGVRLTLTLLSMFMGFIIVLLDALMGLRLSAAVYTYLGGVLATTAVFVFMDTQRPTEQPKHEKPVLGHGLVSEDELG